MKQLLSQLNQNPGIQGSMVITPDGIMVASEIGPELNEDAVAALSSSLMITLKRACDPLGYEIIPEELVLTASEGKLIFFNLKNAFLVVVSQPQLRLNTDLVEIRSIARKLRDLCAAMSV